ncbi:P450-derived glycosyltransferase activator [Actinokineospora baliensis]|uniref:cytochrome P450 n=1 Tax=Actinokineospora baliensis TaxID=547056 RepID=UPI001958820B|nr:cytochrome P450 [Actinokineospora baliensis]MBM7769842.1 P450-derived glycosyltransferase activator [Actinokineospora baliensis]
MTDLADRQARAQMALWQDHLRAVSDRGDPYALLLRAPEDPYPLYEQVRARGPLHLSGLGVWVTASYRLANKVLRDKRFGVRRADGTKAPEFMPFDNSMLGLDPPEHTRLRKLSVPSLNPRRLQKWLPVAERVCDELIDRILAGRAEFNFMSAFAQQLPLRVIGDLVGIPERHRRLFFQLSRRMAYLLDGVASVEVARDVRAAIAEMTVMFTDIVALRRVEPGDDLISDLLPAVDDGRLAMDELVPLCMFLPLAGTETTVNLIGNAVRALLGAPEQWARFKDDPALAPAVVQETLRYDTPVQQYRRIAHTDVELDGHVVPAGAELAICAGAANRDPEVYSAPDRFDIGRESGPDTLSFSAGIHFCLGAALARIEAEIALVAVARRLPDLRRVGQVRRRDSFIIRGMLQFPVAVG